MSSSQSSCPGASGADAGLVALASHRPRSHWQACRLAPGRSLCGQAECLGPSVWVRPLCPSLHLQVTSLAFGGTWAPPALSSWLGSRVDKWLGQPSQKMLGDHAGNTGTKHFLFPAGLEAGQRQPWERRAAVWDWDRPSTDPQVRRRRTGFSWPRCP